MPHKFVLLFSLDQVESLNRHDSCCSRSSVSIFTIFPTILDDDNIPYCSAFQSDGFVFRHASVWFFWDLSFILHNWKSHWTCVTQHNQTKLRKAGQGPFLWFGEARWTKDKWCARKTFSVDNSDWKLQLGCFFLQSNHCTITLILPSFPPKQFMIKEEHFTLWSLWKWLSNLMEWQIQNFEACLSVWWMAKVKKSRWGEKIQPPPPRRYF